MSLWRRSSYTQPPIPTAKPTANRKSVKGLSVSRNDGSVCDTMELLPSACFIVDFRKEQGAGTFVFTGGGYGHGVGMSQNGAKHLAENGLGWRDILQIFYQNITIENLQEY